MSEIIDDFVNYKKRSAKESSSSSDTRNKGINKVGDRKRNITRTNDTGGIQLNRSVRILNNKCLSEQNKDKNKNTCRVGGLKDNRKIIRSNLKVSKSFANKHKNCNVKKINGMGLHTKNPIIIDDDSPRNNPSFKLSIRENKEYTSKKKTTQRKGINASNKNRSSKIKKSKNIICKKISLPNKKNKKITINKATKISRASIKKRSRIQLNKNKSDPQILKSILKNKIENKVMNSMFTQPGPITNSLHNKPRNNVEQRNTTEEPIQTEEEDTCLNCKCGKVINLNNDSVSCYSNYINYIYNIYIYNT